MRTGIIKAQKDAFVFCAYLLPGEIVSRRGLAVPLIFADKPDLYRDGRSQNKTGKKPCNVKIGDRFAGDCAVQDENRRWGDEDVERAPGAYETHAESLWITLIHHPGDGDEAERCSKCRADPRDGGEDNRREHDGYGKAPVNPLQDGVAQFQQRLGQTAFHHEIAAHNKIGDGDQHELVDAPEHLGRDAVHLDHVKEEEARQGRNAHAEGDRHAEKEHDNEHNEQGHGDVDRLWSACRPAPMRAQ